MRGSLQSPLTATSLRGVSDYERNVPVCIHSMASDDEAFIMFVSELS